MTPATEYNTVLYPSKALPQTHPDRLATLATLHGMAPADVKHCRMLELGCNTGLNLIALATALPNATFVGYDLAEVPIAAGQQLIEKLQLRNVQLEARNIMELPETLGTFDYIVAHGLYSWVPEPVRRQLLAICQQHLSPQGVAYISYNTYPGNHMRDMARGIMHFHTQQFSEPAEKIRQSRAIVQFFAESRQDSSDTYQALLKDELGRITDYPDSAFFHDDLSQINQPVYFHQFVREAADHELQFVGELRKYALSDEQYKPEAIQLLQQLKTGDRIAYEQYFDFLTGKSFRQTLLCRQGVPVLPQPELPILQNLFIAAPITVSQSAPAPNDPSAVAFTGLHGSEFAAEDPLVQHACRIIGDSWPQPIAFKHLLNAVHSTIEHSSNKAQAHIAHAEQLAQFLLEAYDRGFVELHTYTPTYPSQPGEFPVASPLIREQLQQGSDIVNLRLANVRIEGELAKQLILLLDGTRDSDQLADALIEHFAADRIARLLDFDPELTPAAVKAQLLAEIDQQLQALAVNAVLIR